MNKSLHDNAVVAATQPLTAHTGADANGTAVDLAGGDGGAMFQIVIGTWTDGNHTLHFEESEDNSNWDAIAAEDLDGYDNDGVQQLASGAVTFTITSGAKDDSVALIGYIGGKRYVRARKAMTGESTGAVYGVYVWSLGQRYTGRNPMRSAAWAADNYS